MPWRLILFILIFGILLTFIMLNLGEENRCIISFGFMTTKEPVPVFLTIFISFFLGLLCALPLSLMRKKSKENPQAGRNAKANTEIDSYDKAIQIEPDEKIKQEAAEAKKRFFAKREGK